MKEKIRLGILFGGRSGEHEVSLASARSILDVIDYERYSVTQIGITQDGIWLSKEDNSSISVIDSFLKKSYDGLEEVVMLPSPAYQGKLYRKTTNSLSIMEQELFTELDVIFPVLHGTFGEDGTLQGLFELNGIAYVGAGVVSSAVGMDKAIFKSLMRAYDLPTVEWLCVFKSEIEQNPKKVSLDVMQNLPYFPLFVKPANLGSSVGITKCNCQDDLIKGLLLAAKYDRKVVIERGVNAREIEISVLGNEQPIVSEPGEIVPSREFYSYEAKYIDNRSELLIPAPLSEEQRKKVQGLALRAYQAVDCSGMARVDFLMDKDTEELFISEINTIPGFTQISMYPKLWEKSGISYSVLVDRLIELAFQRRHEKERIKYKKDE